MAESRLIPCNLMAWPRIRDLLPDQKLILYHLWSTCHEASGCQLLDLGAFQGALNITATAIQEALFEFKRRGLIDMDEESGEVFILDWFRFHKFQSPSRLRLLEDSIRRIQSPRLNAIANKSMTYALREGKEREGKKTTTPNPHPRDGGGGKPPGGGGGGRGRVESKQPLLPLELEQAILDELQGRQEAAAKGEAPKIGNTEAWLKKLRERAASGANIITEHGMRVQSRRDAQVRHHASLNAALPKIDEEAAAKGAALLAQTRREAEVRASGGGA